MRSRKGRGTAGLAVGLAAVLLAVTACGGDDGGDGEDGGTGVVENPSFEDGTTMAALAEAGKIRVGTKIDQPGFGIEGLDGEMEGFDVEIAKIIAGKLGIAAEDIEWIESQSKFREEYIEQGRVDMVVATYTINDERKQRVTFAGPYYTAGQQLMTRSDESAINGPDDLKANPAAKVCSVTGSTPAENIKEYLASPDQLVLFDVYEKCVDALRNNQVRVVTTDNVILLGFVSESDGAYKLVGEQFTEEPYGIGVKKGDVAFCEFINETLTEAAESGAYKEAWDSTAGRFEGTQTPELPELAPCA